MRTALIPAILLAVASPAAAQGPLVASVGAMFEAGKANVIAAAEQMPEEHYAFQPTPEVRTFGQLVGHVANASYMICATATGQANPNQVNHENTTSKAALVKAVTDALAYCDAAYSMGDEDAKAIVTLFGRDQTKMSVLALNAVHDWEHYGNMVTYMRMKGLVPPSSQGN